MTGRSIHHYRILDKLGEGGMGVVYRAEDTRLGRTVALKFLSSGATSSDHRTRFLREARAAAGISHPNICTIHDIHDDGESLFIVMELVEGMTLRQHVRDLAGADSAMDIGAMITCATQIAEQHAMGIRFFLPFWLRKTVEVLLKIAGAGGEMPEHLSTWLPDPTPERWKGLVLQHAREHATESIEISVEVSDPK